MTPELVAAVIGSSRVNNVLEEPVFSIRNNIQEGIRLNIENYLNNLRESEEFSQENGLRIADMPTAIQFMTLYPELQEEILRGDLATNSREYYGWNRIEKPLGFFSSLLRRNHESDGRNQRKRPSDTKVSYMVLHGANSVTYDGIKAAFDDKRTVRHYFENAFNICGPSSSFTDMLIMKQAELASHLDNDVPQIPLYDAEKGDVPEAGTPYAIHADPKKDFRYSDHKSNLTYDNFMRNRIVLMRAGGPEQRESLAKMLFPQEDDGEELKSVNNSSFRTDFPITDWIVTGNIVTSHKSTGMLDSGGIGNPVYLSKDRGGLSFYLAYEPMIPISSDGSYPNDFPFGARFLTVNEKLAKREEDSTYALKREDSIYSLEKLVV